MKHSKNLLATLATTTMLTIGSGAAFAADYTISVWANAGASENYRIDAIKIAADLLEHEYAVRGEEVNITIEGKTFTQWNEFKQGVTLAAEAGAAPNIVVSGHEDIAPWSQSGLIAPIEDYLDIDAWPINAIFDNLMDVATFQDQVWGIPQDAESRPFFFWKDHMNAIGYSDADLDGLADAIKAGDYTLANVLEDARKMIDAGLVDEGKGFWPRPSKGGDYWQFYTSFGGALDDGEGHLLLDKTAMAEFFQFFVDAVELGVTGKNHIGTPWDQWHGALTSGKVGMWHGGTWQYGEWTGKYELDFFEEVTFSLIPGGGDNGQANTLTHPLVYLVTTQDDEDIMAISAELIAIASEPRINALHAIKSAHLGISPEEATVGLYAGDRWAREATAVLLPSATAMPNHVNLGQYFEVMFGGLQAAWTGQKTVDEAIADMETELKASLGDKIVIR
jgi:inositol-phosphate transport system substrate-binding protein